MVTSLLVVSSNTDSTAQHSTAQGELKLQYGQPGAVPPKLRDVKNIEAVPLISLSEVFLSGFCISIQGCRIEVKKG